MSHTYTNLLTHIIFSTKDREPLITAAFRNELLAALGGIIPELGGALRAANPRPDHVHLLCSMPPAMASSENCSTAILAVTGHGQDARVTRCVPIFPRLAPWATVFRPTIAATLLE